MEIHNSENASLLYLQQKKMIYIALVGFINDDEIKIAAENLKSRSGLIKATNILADTSSLNIIKSVDFKIIVDTVFPIFRQMGIKKAAIIKSSNVFGQSSLRKLLKHVEIAKTREFNNMISAEEWLLA